MVPFTTSGDRWRGDVSALGGKGGAFTTEIDAALIEGRCDLAVHCMKDVPGDRPVLAGTVFAAYPIRDDIRDALIHPGGLALAHLRAGTRVGASSVRRIAQLARDFPHLATVPIRGNANTRLATLDAGQVDALLLAVSGLHRIDHADRITQVLPAEVLCPPIGAGALGLQCRQDDTAIIEAVTPLGDPQTWRQVTAERMLLHVLQGHCNSPIAGYAIPTTADRSTTWPVEMFFIFDNAQVNVELVTGFLSITQPERSPCTSAGSRSSQRQRCTATGPGIRRGARRRRRRCRGATPCTWISSPPTTGHRAHCNSFVHVVSRREDRRLCLSKSHQEEEVDSGKHADYQIGCLCSRKGATDSGHSEVSPHAGDRYLNLRPVRKVTTAANNANRVVKVLLFKLARRHDPVDVCIESALHEKAPQNA